MRKIVQIYFLLGVATASAAGINPGSGGGGGGGGLTSPVAVADGGTGKTSLTAYALMAGGTTSTGDMQQVSGVGTAGQCLLSAGAGALPAWGSCGPVTLPVGSSALASGTAGRVLFEGTGNVLQESSQFTVSTAYPGEVTLAPAGGHTGDVLTLTAGTLGSQKRVINVTATLSTAAATQQALKYTITSAGSASGIGQDGVSYLLSAGYTGAGRTTAVLYENATAGTGTDAVSIDQGNYGAYAQAYATTTGTNVGVRGQASNGNTNFGIDGVAIAAKNSATNVGVLGLGLNTGTSPVQVGGYFGLQATMPTFASAALIADNGSTTSNVLTLRDNGTNVLESQDSGKLLVKNSSNSTTAYQFQNAAGTNALVIDTSNLRSTTPVLMAGTAPIANSDWSTFGGVVNAGGTGVVSSVVTTSSSTDYDCLVLENTGSGSSVVSSLCMFGSSFVSGGTWFNPANGSRFRTSANATAGMVFDTGAGPIYFGTSDVERVKLTDNGLENGNASFSGGDVRFNDSVSIAGQVKMDSQSAGPFTCNSGNEGRFYYRSTGSKSGLCVCGADDASYSFQVSAAHNGFAAGDC